MEELHLIHLELKDAVDEGQEEAQGEGQPEEREEAIEHDHFEVVSHCAIEVCLVVGLHHRLLIDVAINLDEVVQYGCIIVVLHLSLSVGLEEGHQYLWYVLHQRNDEYGCHVGLEDSKAVLLVRCATEVQEWEYIRKECYYEE